MPFMRRTATVVVSIGVVRSCTGAFCTVEEASEAKENHLLGLVWELGGSGSGRVGIGGVRVVVSCGLAVAALSRRQLVVPRDIPKNHVTIHIRPHMQSAYGSVSANTQYLGFATPSSRVSVYYLV